MKTLIFTAVTTFLMSTFSSSAQISKINWNVIPDSITLNPSRFECEGSFIIKYSKESNSSQFDGKFIIHPKDKVLYFNNGDNLIKFSSYSDIVGIDIKDYRNFDNTEINSKDFYDSLLYIYRRNTFNKIDLIEVEVLLTKKNRFEVIDNELKVKKPLIVKGKLCSIDLNQIILLTEEGDLVKLYDGDFNYIKIESFKVFECNDLYNYLFARYEKKLNEIISNWKIDNKNRSLEYFIDNYGPFDNFYQISNDKKIVIWNRKTIKYYINMNSTNHSSSYTYGYLYRNQNISPLFYYNSQSYGRYTPSYISTNDNIIANNNNITSSSSRMIQNGEITSSEESMIMTLILDSSGKIQDSYQERMFANPEYGKRFQFINY